MLVISAFLGVWGFAMTGNVQTVMDGNLDGFIESYLKYINSNK